MTQAIQQLQLNKLIPSDANVRHTGRTNGIGELAASIKAHGLLQNLTVRRITKGRSKTVLYEVVAGGRRLAALKSLVKAKHLKKDSRIPCHVLNGEIAEEISLAENQHEPMHPADQYEAFALLHREHNLGIEDIAARFGVTATVVRQRLKLGAVSPNLLTCYRAGEMSLDQLSAFTVCPPITHGRNRYGTIWAATRTVARSCMR
jgi:ParB family transcriptional regulator, chromosome partitioning protein